METKKIVAIAVVAIVVVAGAAVMFGMGGGSKNSDAAIASQLQIMGNINDDYTIDNKDMAILEDILSGKKDAKGYPLADVNNDGKVDSADKTLLQKIIDRKEGITINVICLDRNGNNTVVPCEYPLRDVVPYATNVELPLLYSNGGEYVAGYFTCSYDVAEASFNSSAVDLKASQRSITDAAWKNFTQLDASLSKGVGALIADYSGVNQITDARAADLEAAGIPLILYSSADATAEITTVLTLGFLFGKECENMGVKYAQESWNVIDGIQKKVSGLSDDKLSSYICCTMYIHVCQNESTFNTSAATAGGVPYYKINSDFAKTYAGTGSSKMSSVEALSNFTNVDTIINNRSVDFGMNAEEMKKSIIDIWDHDNSGVSSTEYFKGFEDKLYYINNILPGAVKVAYMAHALYGDLFSEKWADGVLQTFIDMGTNPLKGQTVSTIFTCVDYDDYKAAKS